MNVTNEIQLPGVVSAMTTDEINGAGKNGAKVLVFKVLKRTFESLAEYLLLPLINLIF